MSEAFVWLVALLQTALVGGALAFCVTKARVFEWLRARTVRKNSPVRYVVHHLTHCDHCLSFYTCGAGAVLTAHCAWAGTWGVVEYVSAWIGGWLTCSFLLAGLVARWQAIGYLER